MVLGKTSSARASYNLYYSRTRASCTCSRCGWGSPLSLPLFGTETEILSQRAIKPKTTNQPTYEKICCDPSLESSLCFYGEICLIIPKVSCYPFLSGELLTCKLSEML